MTCNHYEKQYSDYLDGLLDQESGDEIRFHLNGCARCQTKVGDMERSISALRGLPTVATRPEFDQVLKSRLHTARTQALYAVPFWVSIKEFLSEVALFTRHRTVQMVFTTSLLLTIFVISGLSSYREEPRSANLAIPAFIDQELAAWDIISPIPYESELAPEMAISLVSHIVPQNTPVAILDNVIVKYPRPLNNNAVLTITTMDAVAPDAQTSLESPLASTTPQQRLEAGTSANQHFNLNMSPLPVVNGYLPGGMPLNSSRIQVMKRLTRPASQIKRIRISF